MVRGRDEARGCQEVEFGHERRGEERPVMTIEKGIGRAFIRFLIGRGGSYVVQGKSHINGLMNE